ncbi:ABC transporter permease [Mesobacillus jeotgali]|uniref:ABC transporter permease n=1 Tax=Mesobacillus jeotgali TaxID=129985 RepID=A0ABY9VBC8_9BACI|nr:ABC transporter permease [Mesobacillus jeotgali]WNF21075.1 ABC transporter permease [Mesobacillus jeotgali]
MNRNWSFWLGSLMFGFLLFFAVFSSDLSFIDPSPADSRMRFYEDGSMARAPFPPSLENPLGTDSDGRDLLSLLIIGTRDTLRYIFMITILRYLIAIPLAYLSAPKRGLAYIISNGWNSLFGSVPAVFSAIMIILLSKPVWESQTGSDLPMYWSILLLALMEVGRVSVLLSHEIHDLSEKEYVKAGIVIGNGPFKLFKNYYLPNLSQSLVINFCNDLSRVTLLIGQLALFGYFIASKSMVLEGGIIEISSATYDWQALLEKARSDLIKAPWIPIFPALAITFTILAFNLLGEGLRQKFDIVSGSSEKTALKNIKQSFRKLKFLDRKKGILIRWFLVSMLISAGIITIGLNTADEKIPSAAKPDKQQDDKSTSVGDAYKKVGDMLVPLTESTTKKGGLYDSVSFIKTKMKQTKSNPYPVFEDEEGIKLVCQNSIDKCIKPVFYLEEPVKTPAEAEQILKGHMPDDTITKEVIEVKGERIYNMVSETFSKSYPLEDKGGFNIIYKRNEENKIFAATVTFGHKKSE